MSLFFWVAATLSIISFVYCFVFVDAKGTGIQAKIKRFLYEDAPRAFKNGLKRLCGERAVWAIERL